MLNSLACWPAYHLVLACSFRWCSFPVYFSVIFILASDWPRMITWPGFWPLIGLYPLNIFFHQILTPLLLSPLAQFRSKYFHSFLLLTLKIFFKKKIHNCTKYFSLTKLSPDSVRFSYLCEQKFCLKISIWIWMEVATLLSLN